MALGKENINDFDEYVRKKIRKLFDFAQKQHGHHKIIEKCRKLQKKCVRK